MLQLWTQRGHIMQREGSRRRQRTWVTAAGVAAALAAGAADAQTVASAAPPAAEPAASLAPSIQVLSQDLATAQATVLQRIQAAGDPEAALADQYAKLQALCTAKFDALDSDRKRYASAEARTNVIGSLLALVGSVTAYAPGKTVLMGLGISSSSSGTVSSGITQFFSKRSATDATSLAILQGQLAQVLDRYEAVDPGTDPSGRRRSGILSRGTNICLGLTPAVDPPDKPTDKPPAPAPQPVAPPPATGGSS